MRLHTLGTQMILTNYPWSRFSCTSTFIYRVSTIMGILELVPLVTDLRATMNSIGVEEALRRGIEGPL